MQKSNGIHNLPVLHIPEYTPTQSFGGSVHKQRTKKAQIPMPPFTARTSNSSGHPGKETIIQEDKQDAKVVNKNFIMCNGE